MCALAAAAGAAAQAPRGATATPRAAAQPAAASAPAPAPAAAPATAARSGAPLCYSVGFTTLARSGDRFGDGLWGALKAQRCGAAPLLHSPT